MECPSQKAVSVPTKQRHKVRFETKVCLLCLLKERCQIFKNKGRYYFTREDYLQNRRNRNIINIPGERRKIRPNVEALMREFKARAPGGKAKVRGLFKTSLFAFNAGIAINFGRIFRYILENDLINEAFSSIAIVFHKILWNIYHIFSKTRVLASNFRNFQFYTKYFSKKPIISPLNSSSF